MPPAPVEAVLSRFQKLVLVGLLVLSMAATSAVLFGPARGARADLAKVQTDLSATRGGVGSTLETSRRTLKELSAQLEVTKTSLEVQRQGLGVVRSTERIAGRTAKDTDAIRRQTTATLRTVRQVIAALGPLRELRGDVEAVVKSLQAGVVLARTTLEVSRQALRDGKKALAVAVTTLETLKRSEQVQRDLLTVGRQTLQQVTEINRKLPIPPIFPTTADTAPDPAPGTDGP